MKEQTSTRLSNPLAHEFATINRNHLNFAGLLSGHPFTNPDKTLQTRGGSEGLQIYTEAARDCHLSAVLEKRYLSMIQLLWEVVPASEEAIDQQAAELVRSQLNNLATPLNPDASTLNVRGFDGVCLGLLEAIYYGYAVAEIIWQRHDQQIMVQANQNPRSPSVYLQCGRIRRICPAAYSLPKTELRANPFPIANLLCINTAATTTTPGAGDLAPKVFWPVFFKRQNLQFWLTFAERYGSPLPIGEYPQGTSQEAQQVLLNALTDITQGYRVIMPEGMKINFIEAARSGSIATYESLCNFCNNEISKCVLGETGTTDQTGSGGSRARDTVGNEVRLEKTQADADLLSETLNRTLIRWITEFNLPGAKPPRIQRVVRQVQDREKQANVDRILYDMGYRRTAESIAATYGEGYQLGN
jgi:phage gp29-like protein